MINVLPENEKLAIRKEYRLRFFAVIFFTSSIFIVLATILLIPSYVFSQNKYTTLKNNLESMKKLDGTESGESLSSIIADINQNLQLLDGVSPTSSILENVFEPVLLARPNGIRISLLNHTLSLDGRRMIEVSGKANDRATLRAFEDMLKKDPKIDRVDLPVSNFSKRTNISFFLTITFK